MSVEQSDSSGVNFESMEDVWLLQEAKSMGSPDPVNWEFSPDWLGEALEKVQEGELDEQEMRAFLFVRYATIAEAFEYRGIDRSIVPEEYVELFATLFYRVGALQTGQEICFHEYGGIVLPPVDSPGGMYLAGLRSGFTHRYAPFVDHSLLLARIGDFNLAELRAAFRDGLMNCAIRFAVFCDDPGCQQAVQEQMDGIARAVALLESGHELTVGDSNDPEADVVIPALEAGEKLPAFVPNKSYFEIPYRVV